MATPISGGTAFDFGAAAQAGAVQPPTTTTPIASAKPSANIAPPVDSIKLSEGAQVRLMNSEGETVSQIVIDTALSTQAVNSYLGITASPTLAAASNK
ncbi:MAG: hypothetical protein WB711_23625 [Terriglobales bacterium]